MLYGYYDSNYSRQDLWASRDGVPTHLSVGPSYSGPIEHYVNAVSADGSAVLFTTPASLVPQDQDGGSGDVYLRSGSTTTLISTGPQDSSSSLGAYEVTFGGVSPDFSEVVFTTARRLVAADTDEQVDAYLRVGSTTTLLSVGPTGGNGGEWTSVQVSLVNWDPACGCLRIYFMTQESLTADDPAGNLDQDTYVYVDGDLRLVTIDLPGTTAR